MEEIRILSELKVLSSDLLTENDSKAISYTTCWYYSTKLVKAIKQDIEKLFNKTCFITDTKFILEDPTYRQGANICKFEIRFEQDESLSLSIECLIDHGKVFIRLKQRPESNEFEFIADLIKKNYDSEFVADIRQIIQSLA